jgi:hypothetical protein
VTPTTGRRRRRAAGVLALATLALLSPQPAEGTAADEAQLRLAAAPSGVTTPLVLGTVPAVAGFPVTVDGVTSITDDEGKAHFDAPVTDVPLSDRLTLTEATVPIGGQQVHVRADRVYPSSRQPLLAVDLSYLVRFQFTGIDGAPVDASSIEALTVKSETGEIVDLPPQHGAWLQGSRVIKRTDLMEVKNLRWSVQGVQFAGSNVVNASQQFFLPSEQQAVDVQLLFFGLDVHVHDAMFGFSYDGEIELVYPDGNSRRFGLDDVGRLTVPALPRGDYTLTILGPGPPMSRPLAVSRDQDVQLAFYSWLDILTVLGVVLGLAGLLAWAGRRRRRRNSVGHPRHRMRPGRFLRRRHGRAGEPTSEPAAGEDVDEASRRHRQLAR